MSAQGIIDASLRLFAQEGYNGASLARIADEVGMKKSSIYAHFSGKEDLFLKVFEQVLHHQLERTEQLAADIKQLSVEERLYRILLDNIQYFLEREEETAFLKRAMLFPPASLKEKLRARFLKSEEMLSELLSSIFREGIRSGQIRPLALEDLLASYYCLLDGAFIQLFYYGRTGMETRVDSVWKIFWSGVADHRNGG
ncbi:transcriptional regulator, TetR family [Melghirimyces thermohalophilus]|uniref:Transcriptional regulator, TetR family n=1 Tax=Melghirimyces thermohalophilus TaxID=1236220 RepID=A0A1G6LCU3_9BACL|nr:TetR/AcrR family transcriptional regulator [Melghirimyces thermohalophilus]SDC40993.1 transcriptional regulator, TetR family [Melghirimyces thermohalophilus]